MSQSICSLTGLLRGGIKEIGAAESDERRGSVKKEAVILKLHSYN